MKQRGFFYIVLIVGVLLILGLFSFAPKGNSLDAASGMNDKGSAPALAGQLNESSLTGTPPSNSASDEVPPPNLNNQIDSVNVLPTPVPGETQLFFVPTDNDATATVLSLYNTDSITHTVALRGFSYNGVVVYSLNISVKPTSFLRLSSDSIASAPPPSWATPAPIITNFTDFTYFASLSLPKGVKAEGYVLFNPGTGVVDPRHDQGAIPLRFSTDPATLFLPTVQNNP
ncbi:MAG: hypothetical protein ACK2UK_03380 [Candidatus Promineifilaceae bacterium]